MKKFSLISSISFIFFLDFSMSQANDGINIKGSGCQHGSLTPNPSNCSTYIHCDHGQALVRPCPSGLHFNPQSKVCDWPNNVNCGSPPATSLECYSCVYIQSNTNLTNEGCEKAKPPSKYKRTDCFGFGNLQVAGSVRHTPNPSHSYSHIPGQQNIHCVKISGYTDSGKLVILRGCESHNETFNERKCFSNKDYEFVLPGTGFVRNVQKCYCKKNGCNEGSTLKTGRKWIIALLLVTLGCK